MKQNIGTSDRMLRLFIGTILLIMSFFSKSGLMAIFGLFTIYESLSGWCVFYQLIGRNTCPIKKEDKKIPFLNLFLKGVIILIGAIALNTLASAINYYTWHDLINNYSLISGKITVDNLLFLFIVYPFSLGVIANLIKNK